MDNTPQENLSAAIERARRTINQLNPRTQDQIEMEQELSTRLIEMLMSSQQVDDGIVNESSLVADVEIIRKDAVRLLKEMPAPERVLLFSDCISHENRDREFTVLGQWIISLNKSDSLSIPHDTKFTIRSVAQFMVIMKFANGIELKLKKESYPQDGIPVQEFEPFSNRGEEDTER